MPAQWQPYLQRRGIGFAQLRMTVWAGLLLGLLIYQALRLWSAPALPADLPAAGAAPATTADPYAEARRSRAILDAQGSPVTAVSEPRGEDRPLVGPVRVIDGDTFDHGRMRVRIADIDTPEVNGRCARETQLAARATQRLRTLLAAGPFELHALDNGRDEDNYGRKLRIVTRGGQSLGDVLVAEGLARTWTGRREPWC